MKRILFLLSFCMLANVLAEESNRTTRKFGAHISVLGDPFPTMGGINLNYNVLDFVRVTAGFGYATASGTSSGVAYTISATTIGGGVRFMVPGWNLTPVTGISFSSVSVNATGSAAGRSISGLSASASLFYLPIGGEWTASTGFHAGLGYAISLRAGVPGLPYVNIGYYL